MRVGGSGFNPDGAFYQDLVIPADMVDGTIRFWYRMETSQTSHPYDFLDVEVRDPASDTPLTTLLSTDDSKTDGQWIEAVFPIGPEYAGRSIRLHFASEGNWSNPTSWYLDEVAVTLCQLPGLSASFSGVPVSGTAPLTVTFTNESSGTYSESLWDFGDGMTSTVEHPVHTYWAAGTYAVSLAVSGPSGSDVFTRTGYVTAFEPVDADFVGAPLSGTRPLTVTFTSFSTGDYNSVHWTFGDGATSVVSEPVHQYTASGTYTVSLSVAGFGGTDVLTRTSYVAVWPQPAVAGFTASPRTGTRPLSVTFGNESSGDYDTTIWTFGDGATSTVSDPIHEYGSQGVYTVSLTVSGAGGTHTLTRTNYITVSAQPVVAAFSGNPLSGTPPLTVSFSNESTGDFDSVLWSFGDGMTNTVDGPVHQYASPGSYTVALAVSGPGGTDTLTQTDYVTVYEPVSAGFSGDPLSGAAPLTVTFTNASTGDYDSVLWSFGDGMTSTADGPIHAYGTAGTYTVALTVSGPGGTDTLTQTDYVTVYEPVSADFSGDPLSGAAPLTVTFTNASAGDFDSLLWDFGDGMTSTVDGPVHVYDAEGVYTVSLTVSGPGGTDSLTKTDYISVTEESRVYLPLAMLGSGPSSPPSTQSAPLMNWPALTRGPWLRPRQRPG
jgi:PKD repeat protein